MRRDEEPQPISRNPYPYTNPHPSYQQTVYLSSPQHPQYLQQRQSLSQHQPQQVTSPSQNVSSSSSRRSVYSYTMNDVRIIASQNFSLYKKIEEDYYHNLLYDIMFESAIDLLWSIKIGNMTLDELYGLEPLQSFSPSDTNRNESSIVPEATSSIIPSYSSIITNSSSSSNKFVNCPICSDPIAAVRFASHLEKCMNGGKRGTRRHYDYLRDEVYDRPKPKKEFVDPFPDSFIVRIKMRNGEPYGNKRRIGVPLEEFLACQAENSKMRAAETTNSDNKYINKIFQPTPAEEEEDQDTIDTE